ncbi:hypothetical protein GCM10023231_21370 [Olivibacter ginsenosidimutans]|uniref:Glycosyltransferase family 9 protein n=1 Tax=Olivibacter ginsenosidimutans TaxID=1176537 RepID=A0ABP9BD63_9SPHI
MTAWTSCKSILVIRADNMGDVLMSSPAIRALKNTFNAKITLLASNEVRPIADLLPEIDDVITASLPWVKRSEVSTSSEMRDLIEQLTERQFDACVVFTVYSQSALPAALLAWMVGIPKRLAYCRENPYELLNYWILEKEPYEVIKHQTERDLDLVERVGAVVADKRLKISLNPDVRQILRQKLVALGVNLDRNLFILHAGVSERKRSYPITQWIQLGKILQRQFNAQILLTGSKAERQLTEDLQHELQGNAYALGGKLSLAELAALIAMSAVVISVNTITAHLASAVETPQVVLYAQTNPQHHPWMSTHMEILEFSLLEKDISKNEIVRFVHKTHYADYVPIPSADQVIIAVRKLLQKPKLKTKSQEASTFS